MDELERYMFPKVDIIGEGKELFREGILQRGNDEDFEYVVCLTK